MPEFANISGPNLTALAAAVSVAISERFDTDDIRTLASFFNALSSNLAIIAIQNEIQTDILTQNP